MYFMNVKIAALRKLILVKLIENYTHVPKHSDCTEIFISQNPDIYTPKIICYRVIRILHICRISVQVWNSIVQFSMELDNACCQYVLTHTNTKEHNLQRSEWVNNSQTSDIF